ncbi:MAG: hypothetical protein ACI8PZ_003804 [Myxococcota bacterium]|jgi:hypothetical protein
MTGLLMALVGVALAGDCALDTLSPPPPTLSVAWVSPLSGRARGWIRLVRTSDLATMGTDLGRTLQGVGLRRRATAPRRRHKVVVFDVDPESLCRPLAEAPEEGGMVGGVHACLQRLGPDAKTTDGCGRALDRETSTAGVEVFRGRWRDLAREGFCVLPAERFVVGR